MAEVSLEQILDGIRSLNQRFDRLEQRFDELENRLDHIEKRIEELERGRVEDREAIIETLTLIDRRLDMLTAQNEQFLTQINDLRVRHLHLTHKVAEIEADVAVLKVK